MRNFPKSSTIADLHNERFLSNNDYYCDNALQVKNKISKMKKRRNNDACKEENGCKKVSLLGNRNKLGSRHDARRKSCLSWSSCAFVFFLQLSK